MIAGKAALVVGHPGHELRVHGWLEQARPHVFVLTDGSGRGERSRIDYTTRLLERAGAIPGSLYGAVSDRALYGALLEGDTSLFAALARELAGAFDRAGIELVVGDAAEGVNRAHDVCRWLIQAAWSMAKGTAAMEGNLAFAVELDPASAPAGTEGAPVRHELDDPALARKLDAARAYEPLAE